jgi:hypothetical protein
MESFIYESVKHRSLKVQFIKYCYANRSNVFATLQITFDIKLGVVYYDYHCSYFIFAGAGDSC